MKTYLKDSIRYLTIHKILLVLILLGFIFYMITIWPSGSNWCYQKRCGVFFWGANSHDAIWHMALSAVSFKSWPFIMPVYSGITLSGYNYLLDLTIYILSLLRIPVSFSFFKLIPFFWFFIFTGLLIQIARKIKNSHWFVFWLLFFSYFGSSFGYIFTLYHKRTIWDSSSLLSMQSGQNLTNLPFSLSLVFLLFIMMLIKKDKISVKNTVLFGVLIFLSFGLKFYGGLVCLFMVGVYYLFKFLFSKNKNSKFSLINLFHSFLIIGAFVLAAIIFFFDPFNSLKHGSVFIFSPFATMHSMIEEPIYFYLKDMVNARYYLYENSNLLNSPRLLFIELFSSLIFIIFSTGLRIFGIFLIIFKIIKKKVKIIEGLIILSMILCYFFLIFFIQNGMWWNIVQFYYFFLFLLNFFTAEFFYEVTKNKKILTKIVVLLIVIILSLPGNLDILRNFTSFSASSYIPDYELKALSFFKKKPYGVVYSSLFKKDRINMNILSPLPLYLAVDSAYVSAYTQKQLYFADFDSLNITNIDYLNRVERLNKKDCSIFKEIDYIYEIVDRNDELINNCINNNQINVEKIYDSDKIKVFKIRNK